MIQFIRLLLIPILCARAGVKLTWESDKIAHGVGVAWHKFIDKKNIWIVSLGQPKTSFKLLTCN